MDWSAFFQTLGVVALAACALIGLLALVGVACMAMRWCVTQLLCTGALMEASVLALKQGRAPIAKAWRKRWS